MSTHKRWAAMTTQAVTLPGPNFPEGCDDGILPPGLAVIAIVADPATFDCCVDFEGAEFTFTVPRTGLNLIAKLDADNNFID